MACAHLISSHLILLNQRNCFAALLCSAALQMANSDLELKKNEGGTPDAIDNALAFGEGPAKEIFGVELSKP